MMRMGASVHNQMINGGERVVSWVDVSGDNIINDGPCTRQKKQNADDSYQFTNMGEYMNNFLMAQTAYVQSMEAIAEVDTVINSAIHHILLTQLGMKTGILTKYNQAKLWIN